MEERVLNVGVWRRDPDVDASPVLRWYQVPERRGLTVLEALQYIWEHQDPHLAFRIGCKVRRCGGCRVRVNGRTRLACATALEDGMRIEPAGDAPLIRDLVTDVFPNVEPTV